MKSRRSVPFFFFLSVRSSLYLRCKTDRLQSAQLDQLHCELFPGPPYYLPTERMAFDHDWDGFRRGN